MTVMLEDVWRILHIPITGELVTYDRYLGTIVVQRIFADDMYIEDGFVAWEDIAALYESLPSMLSGIVRGLLCPDRRSHGLAVGWGLVIEKMMTEGTCDAWGPCVLAHLYKDLHEAVYREARSQGVGITLLHIWAWEHLPITWPVCLRFRAIDQPYVYMYGGLMSQPHLGKEFWRRALDDLDTIIWRPNLDCDSWEDDGEALPYVFVTRFLIGHTSYYGERQFPGRVMRQFGQR